MGAEMIQAKVEVNLDDTCLVLQFNENDVEVQAYWELKMEKFIQLGFKITANESDATRRRPRTKSFLCFCTC